MLMKIPSLLQCNGPKHDSDGFKTYLSITNSNVPSYKKYFPVLLTPRRISKLAIAAAVEPEGSAVIENTRLDSNAYHNSHASNVCVKITNSTCWLSSKIFLPLVRAQYISAVSEYIFAT